MSDYLKPAELHDLTGSPLPSRQTEWLRRQGWRFVADLNGRPKVLRAFRDAKLGTGTSPPKVEPAWDRLNV